MCRPQSIRILGAGVAGLAAAIALAEDGHHIELIDERFEIPSVGTSLGMFASAQSAMARLGVLDDVRNASIAPRRGVIYGQDGQAIATLPAGDALLLARSDLVQILRDAVPESVQQVRRRIEDVRPLRAGVDLLIGADGVHSLVRRSGWPGRQSARTHGMTVLRGTADIAPPEISETWGGGWLFGITPLAGATFADTTATATATTSTSTSTSTTGTNWFACLPEHRAPSVHADLAHLRSVVGGRRPAIDAVLAAARPESTLVHGLHTTPPVHPVRENVVLLGDAAHAMAPNLGHGANTALQDAVALATALRNASAGRAGSNSATLSAALRAYARNRALPGHAWRIGSALMLRTAMMDEHAGLRDRAVQAAGSLARRRAEALRR
ncbi:MAG: FAD-dependent monooxygenase [Brachybacterium tyrofermentans]